MKAFWMAGLLALTGCAASRQPVAVSRVAAPIERADVVAVQSRARVRKVQARIATAKDAVTALRATAAPGQWVAIEKVEVSLAESTRLLDEELEQNKILTISLNTARDALTDVLLEQDRIMAELEAAQKKAWAYTRLKLWIATLVAAIAAWLAWQFIPGMLGPYKWWAVGGAAAAAFGAIFLVL
ncbi:MAG TPA: hypothetical protein VNQ90_04930 [Chthoniobacteraceae bacterium]|nr:hypothetical protein [Chthoniobacteraceae bacterium]